MAISRNELFNAALDLSTYDRNQLAGLLYDSLPDEEEVEEAIEAEAHRRWLQFERGEIEGIPEEEVLEQLQRRLERISPAGGDAILPEHNRLSDKDADWNAGTSTRVLLDPDVAEVFPDADSVNRALRALARIIREDRAKPAA